MAVTQRKRLMTQGERACLIHACLGLTAAESAERSGRSVNTILDARKRAKAAMGARNITHAAFLALAEGEFTVDDVQEQDER